MWLQRILPNLRNALNIEVFISNKTNSHVAINSPVANLKLINAEEDIHSGDFSSRNTETNQGRPNHEKQSGGPLPN